MAETNSAAIATRVWQVGALCRAVADVLEAKLNPVTVRGEIAGLATASSGHCYFSLKDASGQLRCVMFRRTASLFDAGTLDGELVEVRGRLAVYEQRGDLQLIVEAISRCGQGAMLEQFLRLKQRLEVEGLFSPARKRALPMTPRGVGIVTSLGAAALHDVVTALRRRAPHIPLVVAPASVQGANAPAELVAALTDLYRLASANDVATVGAVPGPAALEAERILPIVDVILLVRGGGSIDDLWAFNDETLARTVAASPVPVVTGIGHETDFCIADFCADLRAPTPTAAAELVAQPSAILLEAIAAIHARLARALSRGVDARVQWLDLTESRLRRPSMLATAQRSRLVSMEQQMRHVLRLGQQQRQHQLQRMKDRLVEAQRRCATGCRQHLVRSDLRLTALDPRLVLRRGYAWLAGVDGLAITSSLQTQVGDQVRAVLFEGSLDLKVTGRN